MSDCFETLSAKPLPQPTDARAARLEKFKREQSIVEYLNRGVSVAEIAAQVGVGEKRLRAIIREILARRMPHPPEEFVAIQMSRLNEALLIAFSAMSTANLKAVDQVVKIVRELDRYGGAFAAEWARPRLDAPAAEDVAFAKAWLSSPGLAWEEGDDRPESPAQRLEKIESAPDIAAILVAALHSPSRDGRSHGRPTERGDAVDDRVYNAAASDSRPENPAQRLGKIESAPGIPAIPVAALHSPSRDGRPQVRPTERGDAVDDRVYKAAASDSRPEIPAQRLEKIESAPGIPASPAQTAEPALASPVSTPDLMLSLLRSAAGRGDLRACLSGLHAGTYGVAPRHGGGDLPFAARTGHARPQNPAQGLENMESAPENGWLDEAGSGSLPSPLVPYPISPGRLHGTFNDELAWSKIAPVD